MRKKSNIKRLLCALMASAMVLGLAACGGDGKQDGGDKQDAQTSQPAEPQKPDEAPAAPADPASMTEEEKLEAMKSEPFYGQTVVYWYDGGNCTSAPYLAEKQGYFDEYGIQVQCLNGLSLIHI